MSNLRKSLLAFISGLIFVSLTPWLHHEHHATKINIMPSQLSALVRDMHWVEFDEKGQIVQEFFSPELKRLPMQQGYTISKPFMKLSKNQQQWEIQANFAHAQENLDLIELKNAVQIKHFKERNREPILIKTRSLRYHPHEKHAESNDLVAILYQDSRIHSQGFNVDLDENMKMNLSQVSGNINPKSSPEK